MDALKEGICGSGDSFEMNHSETDYNIVDMEAYPLAHCSKRKYSVSMFKIHL
jgi:adenosylhomocysteine nucleosidase